MDYENLTELSSDTQLEAKFRTVSLTIFWLDVFEEYPNLPKQAIRILLPFATTYLWEPGLSKYFATKTKCRNKLEATPVDRCPVESLAADPVLSLATVRSHVPRPWSCQGMTDCSASREEALPMDNSGVRNLS
ncbi:zinc finger BED domain-containing protein 5 [Trichonephila inaurata madagascariensis]|uniref:Zinc finger BED domain-containing protein 5 n=1 Tax=Trichonephila inaurata madagascariensis TaxID=2747483 RepID=A0A8X6MDT8_9ARAC|nr:zinc finger BED domain-containing protein 5 [Trichonephila inaurata madagascariensis]